MKEIKFRAWDKWGKKWVEKDLMLLIPKGELRELTQDGVDFTDDNRYEVVQYTGLKDKNDKEIYEGDIIQTTIGGDDFEHNKYRIFWEDKHASFDAENITDKGLLINWWYEIEVIGNIYENPKLIKENG